MDELIVQGIQETFREVGIKDEVIEKFLFHSQDVTFTKTKDRTRVARMNKACENVHFFAKYLDSDTIFNTRVSVEASNDIVGDGKNNYIHPDEELYRNLEDFAEQRIFSSKVVQLKVTLDLEGHLVWRRIVVPLHRTFPRLHEIVQISFGWKDYHLHEFTIFY